VVHQGKAQPLRNELHYVKTFTVFVGVSHDCGGLAFIVVTDSYLKLESF
jgi:hypothetical protein